MIWFTSVASPGRHLDGCVGFMLKPIPTRTAPAPGSCHWQAITKSPGDRRLCGGLSHDKSTIQVQEGGNLKGGNRFGEFEMKHLCQAATLENTKEKELNKNVEMNYMVPKYEGHGHFFQPRRQMMIWNQPKLPERTITHTRQRDFLLLQVFAGKPNHLQSFKSLHWLSQKKTQCQRSAN